MRRYGQTTIGGLECAKYARTRLLWSVYVSHVERSNRERTFLSSAIVRFECGRRERAGANAIVGCFIPRLLIRSHTRCQENYSSNPIAGPAFTPRDASFVPRCPPRSRNKSCSPSSSCRWVLGLQRPGNKSQRPSRRRPPPMKNLLLCQSLVTCPTCP